MKLYFNIIVIVYLQVICFSIMDSVIINEYIMGQKCVFLFYSIFSLSIICNTPKIHT